MDRRLNDPAVRLAGTASTAFSRRLAISLGTGLALATGLAGTRIARAEPSSGSCASGFLEVDPGVCCFEPELDAGKKLPETLVVFLHGLMPAQEASELEWQTYVKSMARHCRFSMLVPSGRPGIGPGRDPNVLGWPTSEAMRARYEEEVLAEWAEAKGKLEARRGMGFKRMFVFGFSNGAYYATSLLARGRIRADGYAMFGGGSGPAYIRVHAKKAEYRPPVYVGIGKRDGSKKDAHSLGAMLRELGWKYRLRETDGGHNVTLSQVKEALAFLESHSNKES